MWNWSLRGRLFSGASLLVAGTVVALALASQARPATSEIVVGPLAIASGTATGQISGFQAGSQVAVDGSTFVVDGQGVVTLNAAPLDGDGSLTIQFTDAQGQPQTATLQLTDASSGLPLSPAEVLDPIVSMTPQVRLGFGDVSQSGTTGDGSGGSGDTGGTGSRPEGSGGGADADGGTGESGGSGTSQPEAPSGAIRLGDGRVSIPASGVTAPARLVIERVSFSPMILRSRKQTVTATVHVMDTRGFVVRDARVYLRGVPERRIRPAAEKATRMDGTASFRLIPTKLLPLRRGGTLVIFVRARKPGEPTVAGTSTGRRLVQLRLSTPRR